MRNKEHYNDPTPRDAVRRDDRETARFHKLLKTIYSICDFAGFSIEERIVLRDNRTGRIWK